MNKAQVHLGSMLSFRNLEAVDSADQSKYCLTQMLLELQEGQF